MQKILVAFSLILFISCEDKPDNKDAALSFTFDDGCSSQHTIIAPIFVGYKFRCTFFINPGLVEKYNDWSHWQGLAAAGFEIGNHGMFHQRLSELTWAELRHEILDAHDLISARIGIPPFSYAHAFNVSSGPADSVIFLRHGATRKIPKAFDKYLICGGRTSSKSIKNEIDKAIQEHRWIVPALHGIGDGWDPVDKIFLVDILNYLNQKSDHVYVDTFGNLAKYKKEREAAHLLKTKTGTGTLVQLICDLDPVIYDFPLTLVVNNLNKNAVKPISGIIEVRSNGYHNLIIARPNASFELINNTNEQD